MEHLESYLSFIKEAELLKSVLRTAWSSSGRQESTAEHSWRLALMAAVFLDEYPELNAGKVLLLCLIHDLGELYEGDLSAALLPDEGRKLDMEERAVHRLFSLLPPGKGREFLGLWREYEDAATPEARFVKAMDKAETILQHAQGENPAGRIEYAFNLEYGKSLFEDDERLRTLRRSLDGLTRRAMDHQAAGPNP